MPHARAGFTKLELVVCIVVLGGVWMLVSRGVQKSYHDARQATCMNKMGVNLAKAHLQFAQTNNRFCGYVNSVGHDHKCVSWVVPLFPYIDRQEMASVWEGEPYEWADEENRIPARIKHPHTYLEVLICPANPPMNEKISPLCYVVNGGYAEDRQPECANPEEIPCMSRAAGTGENIANGVFHDQYGPAASDDYNPQVASAVTLKYLVSNDGASRTLMLSENVQLVTTWYTTNEDRAPLTMLWWQSADTPETAYHQINTGKTMDLETIQPPVTRKDFARPSSYHAGGVNMAFCDGHGKFVSESIDYKVYKQLMTTAGQDSDDRDNIELEEDLF